MEADKQLIAEEEGLKDVPYYDSEGYVTWGIGHLCDPRKPTRIPMQVVQLMYDIDLAQKRKIAEQFPGYAAGNEFQRAVLTSMCFQMGGEPFDGDGVGDWKNFVAALKAGDFRGAATHGRDSLWWRKQTPERAERQMRMLESGLWVPWEVTRKERRK